MSITNIQNKFLSIQNFKLSWERVIRSSHIENKDRIALRVFAANVDFYLEALIDEIRTNTYAPSEAYKLYLPKSSGTLRTIPVLSMRDRVVYQAMANLIVREAKPHLSVYSDRNVFAHLPQDNNSLFPTMPWLEQFTNFSKKYEGIWNEGNQWVVDADISAFYSSIDHQLLIDLIRQKWISDEDFLGLLKLCLTKWSPHEHGPELNSGLPQGYEASDLLATLFLLPIDEKMSVGHRYIRYVDDIRILAPNQNAASKALVNLDLALQTRALILQTKKTAISKVVDVRDEKIKLRRRFSIINVLTGLGVNQSNEFRVMFLDAFQNLNKFPKQAEKLPRLSVSWLRIVTAIGKFIIKILDNLPWRSKILKKYLQSYRLKSMFIEAWHNLRITPETSDTTIAFTLYRLDIDIKVGKIALKLLELLPSRSQIINNYLSKFVNEKQIVDGVLQTLQTHTVYSWHLANCIRTISKIADINIFRPIALDWINNPRLPWPQRLAAVEVLQEDQTSHAALYSAIQGESNINLKRTLITVCSFQAFSSGATQEVGLLIRECLQDNNNEIKALGIWLLRQFPTLSWANVNFQGSLGFLQPLVPEASQAQSAPPCFIKHTLRTIYGVRIKDQTDLKLFFSDYSGAERDLRKAVPYYYTDPNLYVGLMNSFNHRIAIDLQPIIGTSIPRDEFGNMLKSSLFNLKVPQLSLYFKQCNDKRSQTPEFHPFASALSAWSQPVTHNEKDNLHKGLKLAYQEFVDIYEQHLSVAIVVPP